MSKSIDQFPDGTLVDGAYLPVQLGGSTARVTATALAQYTVASNAFAAALSVYGAADAALAAAFTVFTNSTQDVLTTLTAQVAQNTTTINNAAAVNVVQANDIAYLKSQIAPTSSSAPVNTVLPTLTAPLIVGNYVNGTQGTWNGTLTGRLYTLKRGNTIVYGPIASLSNYLLKPSDGGTTFVLVETVQSAFPDVSATSIGYVVGAAPAVPVNTALPSIAGTVQLGAVALGQAGTYTNTPTSYSYRWLRSGVAIAGETSNTHTWVSADIGVPVRFEETATNGTGDSVPALSAAVILTGGIAPSYTGGTAPSINAGTYQVGVQMTGNVGAPVNNPDPSLYTYQWYRGGVAISGATNLAYTPITADGNNTVTFGVIARNAFGASPERQSTGVSVLPLSTSTVVLVDGSNNVLVNSSGAALVV